MKRPESEEFPEYYKSYIDLVENANIIKEMNNQVMDIQALISEIPEDKENYAYAEGKWTIKEILGHIIDSERTTRLKRHDLVHPTGSTDTQSRRHRDLTTVIRDPLQE